MAETSVNETKPSVVDDFFSALFAKNTTFSSSNNSDTTNDPPSGTNNNTELSTTSHSEPEQSDDVLDEFDEYSLLSSRKQTDDHSGLETSSSSSKFPGDYPAQILSKREIDWSTVTPESRMLIRQLPKSVNKQDVMNHFSKYGEVIEVVKKNSFGFVHFENPDICARAVKAENGKYYHGVILDLEICKKKPFFARVLEAKANKRRDVSPPSRRSRSPSPSRSRSPQRRRNRRNSLPRHNNDRRARRNEPYADYNRPYRRDHEYQPKQAPLIPFRNSQNVPVVQIVSWSNAYRNFVNHVEGVFAHRGIRTSAVYVQFSQANREAIVKQMVMEGVKALIIVDSLNESKHKVYLQVFQKNENGEGVRYDEYDSITPNEAMTIVSRSISTTISQDQQQQQNYTSQYQYNGNPYNTQYNGYKQQPYIQPQYNQQPSYMAPQQQQPIQAPVTASIDTNTLNALYSLLQNNTAAPQPVSVPVAPVAQPSIPQLIATLMNGLNKGSPQATPTPTNYPTTVPLTTPSKPTLDQPSIAALLSTASNGNPAIAQLLYQMTSGVTNIPSQPPTATQATNQTKSEYTHSR